MSGYTQAQLEAIAAQSDLNNGLPAGTVEGQLGAESNWNPSAYNASTGATGIAQILPSTAADPGYGVAPVNPNDPAASINFMGQYDAALANRTGSVAGGLLAYNQGLGNYETNGAAGASPAYQQLAQNAGNATVSGTSNTGSSTTPATSGTGLWGKAMNLLQTNIAPSITGGNSSMPGVAGMLNTVTGANGTGTTGANTGGITASIVNWMETGGTTDILFVVVGLMLLGAAIIGLVMSSSSGREIAVAAAA